MELISRDRWNRACVALGANNPAGEYDRLVRAWTSWGRRYHTLGHLSACLQELDAAQELATEGAEVEIALWFHDAIYRTYRNDNESRCAAWAATFLLRHGVSDQRARRIRDLVLATRHVGDPVAGDAALVVDVDLSILGQPPDVYDDFERNVREEYRWVPRHWYARKRLQVLRSFLSRRSIYFWPKFRDRYETTARNNIARAIENLGAAAH
jgi:predicted metal-dependent HD superfamily phosphohydrolase